MFEILENKRGEYYFVLKARNGQTILTSGEYTTKASCENGIESVKKNSRYDERFERLYTKKGKPYFRLKATNGQIIGESMFYESEASRENGIESVKRNAYE